MILFSWRQWDRQVKQSSLRFQDRLQKIRQLTHDRSQAPDSLFARVRVANTRTAMIGLFRSRLNLVRSRRVVQSIHVGFGN